MGSLWYHGSRAHNMRKPGLDPIDCKSSFIYFWVNLSEVQNFIYFWVYLSAVQKTEIYMHNF